MITQQNADIVITVNSVDDLQYMFSSLLLKIAVNCLKEVGYYRFEKQNKKYYITLKKQ